MKRQTAMIIRIAQGILCVNEFITTRRSMEIKNLMEEQKTAIPQS